MIQSTMAVNEIGRRESEKRGRRSDERMFWAAVGVWRDILRDERESVLGGRWVVVERPRSGF